MKRATAYNSSCSQDALVLVVYLYLFCRSLLSKCASQTKIAKKTLNSPYFDENRKKTLNSPYFEGSKSLKVIDVDTTKKLVTSACYDKQYVWAYLQPFSRYTSH